ncbi:MAG TPA: DUF3443 family protein [Kofleriaceae bacterium]
MLAFASCATSPQPPTDIQPCDPDPAFDPGTWQGSAVVVPIVITQVGSDGATRFSINLEVGDAPLDVLLDTGSTGLRVFPDAVPDTAFACATTTASTYSYKSGLELDGVVARATIAIGGVATPAPIPVMYVDNITCASGEPDCVADGASGFHAILGIGLRNGAAGIGSPIAQLPGQPSFVVHTPAYGADGTLTIGPSDASAFATLQLPPASDDGALANGTPAWDDRYGIPTCLDDMTGGTDYCEPGIWDTGNPPITIDWPAAAGKSELALESEIAVTIGPPAAPLDAYAFTVGTQPVAGIDEIEVEPAVGEGFINLGTALFFRADALFDPLHGIVGLAPH